jgi:CubicO group peptidase (beta-lactamase class C family)
LEKLAKQTLTQTGVPGIAIAVVHQDRAIFKQGFGVREAGKPGRVDADTVFQLASVSKPLASTVLAKLVDEKRIDWDDRVIDHDPGFRMFDPYVTRELSLRDLLCHRSGLPDHAGDLLEDIGYDRQEILRRLRFQPPANSFRSHYAYTNFGFSEAGYAAAKTVGESWEALARKKLFEPAGMRSTSYRFDDYAGTENRARLHVRVGGKWVPEHIRQPDAQAPAGGASSNLNDLIRWVQLELNNGELDGKRLIAATALAETHKPQIVTDFDPERGRVVTYGFGWIVSDERGGRVFYKHSGEFSLGMRTEVALCPSEKLGIVVLSNAAPTGVPEGLTESFFDLVFGGKLERNWMEFANRMVEEQAQQEKEGIFNYGQKPKNPTAALALDTYVGKYSNDFFGQIEIVKKQDALMLHLGPKPMRFNLRHWDRDTFIYQPSGENATGPSGLHFQIAPGGQADQVCIDNLDVHGLGTFLRLE